MTQEERHVYQVSEINREANALLEDELGYIWVEGELSQVKKWGSSGHIYFSVKDDRSVLSAAFFRNDQRGLDFELKDGEKVRLYGRLSIYEKNGRYQMIVRKAEPAGMGSLQVAFEKLKKKLSDEGLFDEARKRELPQLPQRIGVVTSPSGAAVQDFLNVILRRFPNLEILIAPARVQGDGAAQEVVDAIQRLEQHGGVDIMVVTRGGGSLEDLWAFNEEIVARAIAASSIPVVSAIGHEIDFTIADFVADLRAPTPSAAAELVVGKKDDFVNQLTEGQRRLAGSLEGRLLAIQARLRTASHSYVFKEPGHLMLRHRQRLEQLSESMSNSARKPLQHFQQRLDEAHMKLGHGQLSNLARTTSTLEQLKAQLKALSPLSVLERGFSITRLPSGRIVKHPNQVTPGDVLESLTSNGSILSSVTETKPGDHHGRKKTS